MWYNKISNMLNSGIQRPSGVMTVWIFVKEQINMKYTQGKYLLVRKAVLAKQIYDFTILCPDIAQAAEVGQFIHILPQGHSLRRPISICEIDKEKGTLRIVFQIKGEGTELIADTPQGGNLDVVGPLGHGFTVAEKSDKVVLVGGGIGVPPILPLAQHYGKNAVVILGFRSADAVILKNDFEKTGAEVIVCTDDGTFGVKGLVTEPLKDAVKGAAAVMSCGPVPMLKAIAQVSEEAGVPCQVSLEERMGCGVGACLVCACKVKKNGEERFGHVCKDGPVFDSREVMW